MIHQHMRLQFVIWYLALYRVAASDVLMTWFEKETKVHDVVEQTLEERLKRAFKTAGLSGILDKNIDFLEAKRESVAEEMKSCMKIIDR